MLPCIAFSRTRGRASNRFVRAAKLAARFRESELGRRPHGRIASNENSTFCFISKTSSCADKSTCGLKKPASWSSSTIRPIAISDDQEALRSLRACNCRSTRLRWNAMRAASPIARRLYYLRPDTSRRTSRSIRKRRGPLCAHLCKPRIRSKPDECVPDETRRAVPSLRVFRKWLRGDRGSGRAAG